jgi:hypothetical protein
VSAPREPYTLKHPVEVTLTSSSGDRTEKITQITLQPLMRAKQLRVLDTVDGDVAKSIAMIAQLSGHPVKVIDELHPEDFAELAEMVENFT